jgi:hypothetical protein
LFFGRAAPIDVMRRTFERKIEERTVEVASV